MDIQFADAAAQKPVRRSQPHSREMGHARMGLCGGAMRLPMTPLSAGQRGRGRSALRAAGLL
jgi:4-hydroxy-tetrahydrodipicolinate synthase